jgi:hypothetical protein
LFLFNFKFTNEKNKLVFIVVDGSKDVLPSSIGYYKNDTLDWLEEQLIKYYEELENWNNWINFANKYNFASFRNGRVPTIQYYENGVMVDFVVYNNDEYKDDIVINSFFDELDGKEMTKEELLKYHDEKVLDFLKSH